MDKKLSSIAALAKAMAEVQCPAVRESLYDQMMDRISDIIDLGVPGETDIRIKKLDGQVLWLNVVVNAELSTAIEVFNSSLQRRKP